MKKRIDFSKLILVLVVVCVLLSVFAACGTNDAPNGGNQTPSGGNNQPNNGPKDDDVISSTQSINNGLAMQMIFDSIAKSKEQGYIGSKYMNFSMSSFLFLEHENTAKYIGINVKKVIIRTLVVSGALCGVAGLLLVGGTNHTISTTTVLGRGFTAIMVSWLAKFNPIYMVFTTFLMTAQGVSSAVQ